MPDWRLNVDVVFRVLFVCVRMCCVVCVRLSAVILCAVESGVYGVCADRLVPPMVWYPLAS